jgi:leucyl aminopeptidase
MAEAPKLGFGPMTAPTKGLLVVFVDEELRFGEATKAVLAPIEDLISRAARADHFTGKNGGVLELVAPHGLKLSRLVIIGVAGSAERLEAVKLGGLAISKVPAAATEATVLLDLPSGPMTAEQAADVALGARLRTYAFDRYKTKRKDADDKRAPARITFGVANVGAARKAWAARDALGAGVMIARDLTNEPPNVLFPTEFARRAATLKSVGVSVDTLDERALKKVGMRALLAVGQGSARESRVVTMRWNGGKPGSPPVAFVGKGVCFDTGGVSIKPAQGMEDMKGDMAGAACVVGLMHALAARKAKVNAVGAIGLVENMPDGNAQRPGDIVTSMSEQTIEIINTDAEGRLVLADLLWYVKSRFRPKLMVDLATLTGAIVVALGHEYAGLFSNDDELAENLHRAGAASGERVWRLPLGPEYDKMIDSKFADMKNTGGRDGGSITAAQFLQRFVDKTPWAHLDIAGTGFASPQSDINSGWASGWGVRLLDRLVMDCYEK